MTFIVGIKCSDGLVLAADSLESDSITNRYRNKLECMNIGSEWGVCWAGSGTSYTVDKFSDKFRQSLGNDSFNRAKVESDAETCLEFIKQSYSAHDAIAVVVGLFGRRLEESKEDKSYLGLPEFYLYKGSSDTACLSPEKEYALAGMDVTLAAFIFENTYLRFIKVDEATKLAVFSTAMMKKYATGVGGQTEVRFYRMGAETWNALTNSEVGILEGVVSVEEADENMSRFWVAKRNLG